jgi:hypothetical protein
MSTNDTTPRRPTQVWVLPAFCVVLGLTYLVAGILADELGFGLFGLALMVGLAAVLLLARGRSETVQGLLDRRDERIVHNDLKATAFAGTVVIAASLAAFVVELARGNDGTSYAGLAALGGAAWFASFLWLRLRG